MVTMVVSESSLTTYHTEDLLEEEESDDEPIMPAPRSWFEESSSSSTTHYEEEQRRGTMVSSIPVVPNAQAFKVGSPLPSPSWKEISSQVLPSAAKELLSSSLRRMYYTAQWTYSRGRWYHKYSDLGNTGGYYRDSCSNIEIPAHLPELPPFSSLPWVDRQLVREWRTYLPDTESNNEEEDFDRARTLVPMPIPRPKWQKTEACFACHKPFGPTRLRHHCRLCGNSFCQPHSAYTHKLPHLGYDPDVPERVCDSCKRILLEQNLAERVAWRLARCRDYQEKQLTPYFETGVDTMEEAVLRITHAALAMAKSIPLGAQATVAVETVDVLRKYGLNGIYTIMLRQEFLAAADLLRKALGINRTAWPLSVHELSAAIFYALAQHRAMRGMNPEREHLIHSLRQDESLTMPSAVDTEKVMDEADIYKQEPATIANLVSVPITGANIDEGNNTAKEARPITPVCEPVSDKVLASLIFYAPMALNFIYATKEVDMQLLAAQQGWRLLYAYLEQEAGHKNSDRPASALFVHEEQKIACVAVRGTATIHDVITDIRQTPVPFPESDPELQDKTEDDWMTVFRGQGLAVCGMAGAAVNLYREHIDSLLFFAKQGYRIRTVGHSLGGGVATLMGVLVHRDLKRMAEFGDELKVNGKSIRTAETDSLLRVYAYGTPSCVDAKLAEFVESFVTTVVHHDDVIPRLTPTSCRGLLKHLLVIRETWVKDYMENDLLAITERARTAWAPRWREGFTLPATPSSSSIKRYCRKQIQYGKKKLLSVKEKLAGDSSSGIDGSSGRSESSNHVEEQTETDGSEASVQSESSISEGANEIESPEEPETRLVMDYMGGIDSNTEGIVIDGDEFFDPDEKLVESDSESIGAEAFDDAIEGSMLKEASSCSEPKVDQGSVSFEDDEHWGTGKRCEESLTMEKKEAVDDESPGAVVLEETPLPRMFIPGKIVHIYSHRGVYKAAYVPRAFREVRRISMAGNMLTDHKAKAYFEALLEVRTVRAAPENPPRWTAFDEDDTCSCCASRFTWASTSNTEAQEARDKHNCRSCGTLVCDPCSDNRIPLPSIGMTVHARVCDRCYNDINGMVTSPAEMTSSYLGGDMAETQEEDGAEVDNDAEDKPTRERERRSAVVDELVSQVKASALASTENGKSPLSLEQAQKPSHQD